jgi:hypothetical protein
MRGNFACTQTVPEAQAGAAYEVKRAMGQGIIFDFFSAILTPFVFKSIVASTHPERSPRRRPSCLIFVIRSVTQRKPGLN